MLCWFPHSCILSRYFAMSSGFYVSPCAAFFPQFKWWWWWIQEPGQTKQCQDESSPRDLGDIVEPVVCQLQDTVEKKIDRLQAQLDDALESKAKVIFFVNSLWLICLLYYSLGVFLSGKALTGLETNWSEIDPLLCLNPELVPAAISFIRLSILSF